MDSLIFKYFSAHVKIADIWVCVVTYTAKEKYFFLKEKKKQLKVYYCENSGWKTAITTPHLWEVGSNAEKDSKADKNPIF